MSKKLKFKVGDKVEIYDWECKEYVLKGIIEHADLKFQYHYVVKLNKNEHTFCVEEELRLIDNTIPKIPYGKLMR